MVRLLPKRVHIYAPGFKRMHVLLYFKGSVKVLMFPFCSLLVEAHTESVENPLHEAAKRG